MPEPALFMLSADFSPECHFSRQRAGCVHPAQRAYTGLQKGGEREGAILHRASPLPAEPEKSLFFGLFLFRQIFLETFEALVLFITELYILESS